MIKALRFVGAGSLVSFGAATFTAAALALKNTRRYVEVAEKRMEYLREEQAGILKFLREEHRTLKEESKREREQCLELQQDVGRLNREFEQLRQEHGRLAEKLERERARRLEYQQQQARLEREERERERERLEAERKIDRLKRELLTLRETQQARETQRENPPSVPAAAPEDLPESREPPREKPMPVQRAPETGRKPLPASSSGTPAESASVTAKAPFESKKPRLGVRMPHPDDETDRGKAPAVQTRSGAQVEMFRKYYDRYLENYQGYVDLAEGLYRARENGEVPPGSGEEREWREKLRRAKDGIARTTSRLDILEEHNPELASDNRISQRAGVARRHAELERKIGTV
jgi:TolA-binding protein